MTFLSGCSREVPYSSNDPAVVDPPATPDKVEIEALGKVLNKFHIEHSLFDIDVVQPGNRHNEGNIGTSCHPFGLFSWIYWINEPFSRDTTIIDGSKDGDKNYKLSVKVNSESHTMMWDGNVTTFFKYNGETKTWDMSSVVFENGKDRDYKYCNPSKVIDILIENLKCYIESSEPSPELETANILVKSLSEQRLKIIEKSGQLYSASDCEKNEPSVQLISNPVIGW